MECSNTCYEAGVGPGIGTGEGRGYGTPHTEGNVYEIRNEEPCIGDSSVLDGSIVQTPVPANHSFRVQATFRV